MSQSQTFIMMFDTVAAYEKYKQEVIQGGGKIKNDYGETIKGFAAEMPPTLVEAIRVGNVAGSGISSFEPDGVVTAQPIVVE